MKESPPPSRRQSTCPDARGLGLGDTPNSSDASPLPPGTGTGWRGVSAGPARGLRILASLFSFVPPKVACVLVLPVVCTWFLHYNRPRAAVVLAMRRLGARLPLVSAFRAYLQFAFTLVDRNYLRCGRLRPVVRLAASGTDREELDLLAGRPLVILGSHCGALEFAAAPLASLGWRVRPVAYVDPSARGLMDEVGDPTRHVDAANPTIVADGSPGAGLRMLRALRAGEALGLKADRAIPGCAPTDLVSVRFLGSPASFPLGPARLVQASRAGALAVSVFREATGRYVLHKAVVPTGGSPDAMTAAWVGLLEEQIRSRPDQWFNFYPFWDGDSEALAGLPETVPPWMRRWGPPLLQGVATGVAAFALLRLLGLV